MKVSVIGGLVLLLVSFVWAIATREVSANLFALWAIAFLYVFSKIEK